MDIDLIKNSIRNIPDFPKKGIQFKDITTILNDPKIFNYVIQLLYVHYQNKDIDVIVGIESRGFIFASPLALKLNCPFALARKPGKLPSETINHEYELEYGTDSLEIHKDSIRINDNVLIIDDLLATGGTAAACGKMVKKLSNKEPNYGFFIDLGISQKDFVNSFSIVNFNNK